MIGLDIGSNSIKAVELDWRKKTPRLKHFGMIHLPPEAIVDGAFMDSASIVDSIRSLVEGLKVKTKNVAVSISGHSVYIKTINVPSMSKEQLEESIKWEAEQQIPFDIDDVNIDFQILEMQSSPDQMPVLLVAAKKDMINDYTTVIEEAGLAATIVDVDSFAIENAFNLVVDSPLDEVVALVNIGASVMNINILHGGASAFTRDISIGGRQITEEIQKRLKMTYEEAEALKVKERDGGPQSAEVEKIIQSTAEQLATEVRRSLEFFAASSAGEIKKIYLSGGCAKIRMLPSMIEERIGTPVEVFNPFGKMEYNADEYSPDYLKEVGPLAAVAIGLALRREDLK
ncbi:MAG TPA: type IV pilus assembly protein PilM [Thermodesulfobacteriota bacterium]|nr:type IV pilus assembly protein PilM [Thermodesulfobacteriota bacterium]